MTYKQIEFAREIRMWIKDIVVPLGVTTTIALSNPDIRNFIRNKMDKKNKFTTVK